MSDKIKILIVDDEPLAHDVLAKYCRALDYVEVVGNCYDGVSTLNFLNEHLVDAILLDIQLPDITGIDLVNALQHRGPKIIFTTAYTEYALQSFDFDQVIDYLNKPVRLPRFVRALDRLNRQLKLEADLRDYLMEVKKDEERPEKPELVHLLIREDKTTHRIFLRDIVYFQSWGNYLKVFLTNNDTLLARKTISDIGKELSASGFIRIHKSYLVNAHHVNALEGNGVIIADQRLPIGRSYRLNAIKQITGP